MRRYLDLLLFFTITLATAALVIALPEWASPVRVALGLVVVLAAPGYALTSALFARVDDIDGIDRLALTLGLSIAAVPLLGLILDATPWGIRLAPIAVAVTAWVALFSALAAWRRARLGSAAAFTWHWGTPIVRQGALLAALVMAVLLGVPALAVALRPAERYTEFYVLGARGQLQDYPRRLEPGEPFRLTLGINNREGVPISYRVGIPFDPNYANAVTSVIEPGDNWQRTLDLVAPDGQGRTKLEFHIYRPEDTEPYRSLHLFVTLPGETRIEDQIAGPVITLSGTLASAPNTAAGPDGAATDPSSASSTAPFGSPTSESAPPAPAEAVASDPPPAFRTHVVQPGETLFAIARAYLGDGTRFEELFELNRDRLSDPRAVPAGVTLRIPVAP